MREPGTQRGKDSMRKYWAEMIKLIFYNFKLMFYIGKSGSDEKYFS